MGELRLNTEWISSFMELLMWHRGDFKEQATAAMFAQTASNDDSEVSDRVSSEAIQSSQTFSCMEYEFAQFRMSLQTYNQNPMLQGGKFGRHGHLPSGDTVVWYCFGN